MTRYLSENDEIMAIHRHTLPKSQGNGRGFIEYESRYRRQCEESSQRLAKAIQKYFERRVA